MSRGAAILALLAGVSIALWVRSRGGFTLDPMELRAQIEEFGWLAPIGFVLVASLRPFLLMPSWVIMSAGGRLFGVVGGIVLGTVGFTFGATMIFTICRGLGRDVVEGYAGSGRMGRIDRYLTQRGPVWMAAWTSVPVTPLTPVHAAAGLSGMPALGFILAVVIGFLPRTALYSYFGDSVAQGDWAKVAVAGVLLLIGIGVGIYVTRRSGTTSTAEPS